MLMIWPCKRRLDDNAIEEMFFNACEDCEIDPTVLVVHDAVDMAIILQDAGLIRVAMQ